jgi:hypothetical protein
MNKEHKPKDNFYGKPETTKENPIHETLEKRLPFHVTYLLLPECEYILPNLFRIQFSKGKLNPFRFVICKRTNSYVEASGEILATKGKQATQFPFTLDDGAARYGSFEKKVRSLSVYTKLSAMFLNSHW